MCWMCLGACMKEREREDGQNDDFFFSNPPFMACVVAV